MSKTPAWEDTAGLSKAVAESLEQSGAIADVVSALEPQPSAWGTWWNAAREALGGQHVTLAGQLLESVERQRTRLWHERVKQVDWELADRGMEAFTWYALEELSKAATKAGLAAGAPLGSQTAALAAAAVNVQLGKPFDAEPFKAFNPLREQLQEPFAKRVFLWPRITGPKGDLVDDEMGRVLQVPGWSNIFTQPIINRIEMLSTGVRTDIGVKVFGADLDTIDRVSKDVEAALKPIPGRTT